MTDGYHALRTALQRLHTIARTIEYNTNGEAAKAKVMEIAQGDDKVAAFAEILRFGAEQMQRIEKEHVELRAAIEQAEQALMQYG